MAADDRKKRILEHLARSSETMKFVSLKKKTEPSAPPPESPPPEISSSPPTPPKVESRKRLILDHLSRSGSDVGKFSLGEEKRKKQIQEHIRQSQS